MKSNRTNSGRLVLQEYNNFGGSKFDSIHLSKFFEKGTPYNFGMMDAEIFASADKFEYKPMVAATEAAGRVYYIPGNTYRWQLGVKNYKFADIVGKTYTGSRPGWNGEEFEIVLSEPYYEEPEVLMLDSPDALVEIVGQPREEGIGWAYTVRVQSSDPNMFIDPRLIEVGRQVRCVGTSVADEMNQLGAGIDFGTAIDLQAQIGAFSRKFELTDKAIQEQLNASRMGTSPSNPDLSVASGYTFPIYDAKQKKNVKDGGFLTFAESKLRDALYMDKEGMYNYGYMSERKDYTGRYSKKTGAGFRQLVKDGFEHPHNGSLTEDDLEDFLFTILNNRTQQSERRITISTATLGERIFDQMLAESMQGALTTVNSDSDKFVRQIPGGRPGELQYGYQFKSYMGKSGLVVDLINDPKKDSFFWDGRRYPYNPNFTVDSMRMDIYDFSPQANSKSPDKSNMAVVKTMGGEEYWWSGGAVDPRTGRVSDGRVVQSMEKMVQCRMADTGGLVIWDTSRIGALYFDTQGQNVYL